jgi:hypothetical protein
MASSTITRVAWTDGPSGTVINNARKNSDIYDKIDEMFAGAGAYATFVFGGAVGIERGQIVFPATQVSSAGANTLDDYEEGSWTPTISGSVSTTGQSYTTQTGRYNKIGNIVTCWFTVILSAKGTITGDVQIGGLPFTSENTAGLQGTLTIEYFENFATAYVHVGGLVQANTSAATIYALTAAGTSTVVIAAANIANNTGIIGKIVYRANA